MPSFKQTQLDFAAHLRNPDKYAAPKQSEDRRLAVYRNLFFNSISSLLAGTFPVLNTLLSPKGWDAMVRDFYQSQHNKTPHFPEIPREFVDYLSQKASDPDKPFIYELAHYEWLELHLDKHLHEVVFEPAVDQGHILKRVPQLNKVSSLQAYHYPVHQISRNHQPEKPLEQAVFLLLWRNSKYQIKFTELNAFSALLWETIQSNQNQSSEQILIHLAENTQVDNPSQFLAFGSDTLHKWHQQGIINAFRTTS